MTFRTPVGDSNHWATERLVVSIGHIYWVRGDMQWICFCDITTTMAIILGTLCSNGVPLASFEKYSYLAPPPPPPYNVEVRFWNWWLIFNFNIVWGVGGGGGRDSHKTCKRLLITVCGDYIFLLLIEILPSVPRSNGHNCSWPFIEQNPGFDHTCRRLFTVEIEKKMSWSAKLTSLEQVLIHLHTYLKRAKL